MERTPKTPRGIAGMGISDEDRNARFMRRIIRDRFTYRIPGSLARYLVDDKETLKTATREHPAVSYSGQSLIWREVRA